VLQLSDDTFSVIALRKGTVSGYSPRMRYDVRNYKVSIEQAKNTLSFHPQDNVASIVRHLIANPNKCRDFDNPAYYNIRIFKEHEAGETAQRGELVGMKEGSHS